MNFVGLHFVSSSSLPIVATFALHTLNFATGIIGAGKAFKVADRDGGKKLAPKSAITSKLFASGIQIANFTCTSVPFFYYATLPVRGWKVPAWAARFALPKPPLGTVNEWQWLGVGLLAATYGFYCLSFYTLSKQGVFSGLEARQVIKRERHRLVDCGPFSVVRHPLYLVALSLPLWTTLSLWNAAPLIQFFGFLASLVPKIPVEEALLEDEQVLGAKYSEYKRKVPYRIIPFCW